MRSVCVSPTGYGCIDTRGEDDMRLRYRRGRDRKHVDVRCVIKLINAVVLDLILLSCCFL